MIVDFHCHIGKENNFESQTFDELKKKMIQNGVDKSVVFPFSRNDNSLISDSLEILEYCKKDNSFIPFLRFNPKTITYGKLNELLNMDFKGVKLHPRSQNFIIDDNSFFWIYSELEKRSIPVIFHCKSVENESDTNRVLNLASKFTNLKIIIGHFFGDNFSLIEELKKFPNVYTETSVYLRTFKLNKIMELQDYKNILFGSDEPYDSQKASLLKVRESKLSKENEDLLFYKNAMTIFGWYE
jgi:predicted TIM-barrel fold metal-dependent hydrolase